MKNIIFIAPPASGKGTYSNMLKERYDYVHISTGDLLRNIIASGSDLGKEVEAVISKGNLVGDHLMFEIIKDALNSLEKNKPFILDGLPRTLDQVHYMEKLFEELNIKDYVVIYLDIDYQTALKRATGRLSCLNCGATYNKYFDAFKPKKENICDKCESSLNTRSDDNEESFSKRFTVYQENTAPILKYYEEKEKLKKIEVAQFTNEEIFAIISRVVSL